MRTPGFVQKGMEKALLAAGVGFAATAMPALTAVMRYRPSEKIDRLTRLYTRGQVALTLCDYQTVISPKIDPNGVYLFVQNHVNALDHCTMYAATGHFKQGIELEKHFKIPFYGPFMKARGTLPVIPGDRRSMRRLFKGMQAQVEKGNSLLGFPEGTRTRDGRVGVFHEGLFQYAARLGIPVVPVTVTGMYEVMPTPQWTIRPFQTVTVTMDAPHPTAGLSRAEVRELTQRVRNQISDRVDAYYDALEATHG